MSVSRSPDDERIEQINLQVLDAQGDIGTGGGGVDGWNSGEFGESVWRVFDLEVPEGYAIKIYAVETLLSDQNEIAVGNPVQVWWLRASDLPSNGSSWTGIVPSPGFLAYHEMSNLPGGNVTEGRASSAHEMIRTDFAETVGEDLCPITVTGDITIRWEYLGVGGEIAFRIWYEYIPIGDDQFLRELMDEI